jgi:hypothetical protein
MTPVFSILTNDALTESFERYFRFTGGIELKSIRPPNQSSISQEDVAPVFYQLVESLERHCGSEGGFRNAIAIIEVADDGLGAGELDEMNPLPTNKGDWASVVAMLVLAFPEIHWIFFTPHSAQDSFMLTEAHFLRASNPLYRILRLHAWGFNPLFDPTGMRNSIHQRIAVTTSQSRLIASHVPCRLEVMAAIDDEESYAYLNSYTAYRFGFRSHVVTSYSMMRKVLEREANHLGLDGTADPPPVVQQKHNISLVFEDLYLGFPDIDINHLRKKCPGSNGDVRVSDLAQRDRAFEKLRDVNYRILVTSGHQQTDDPDRRKRNYDYLRTWRDNGKWAKTLYKPTSGIFNIWRNSRLQYKLEKGKAAGFRWPPKNSTAHEAHGGHSAPGRLLAVAERLIIRANTILKSATTVPDALYGALLAMEAQELLGNRTPTLSLEALALKHQLEVLAECMFYGVEYNMEVDSRLDDIEAEIHSIGYWFRPKTRKISELNANSKITSELVREFREYNQFNEEQRCLVKARELQRSLWIRKHKSWAWLFYPPRWYFEFLLSSIPKFILAIALWVIILSLLFNKTCFTETGEAYAVSHGFIDALTAFFGLQPPHELKSTASTVVTSVAIIGGFAHLGIFISHLYSIIMRR